MKTQIDLQDVRYTLDLSPADFGRLLAVYAFPKRPHDPFHGKTVRRWEREEASVPGFIIRACVGILVDTWASNRVAVPAEDRQRLDELFARLIHPVYAQIIAFRHYLQKHPVDMRPEVAARISCIKASFDGWIRRQYGVDVRHVWSLSLDPCAKEVL